MVINWPLATLRLMGEAWEAGEEADSSPVDVKPLTQSGRGSLAQCLGFITYKMGQKYCCFERQSPQHPSAPGKGDVALSGRYYDLRRPGCPHPPQGEAGAGGWHSDQQAPFVLPSTAIY